MNRTWVFLVGLAIIVLLSLVGYEFYLSFSGQKSTFTKGQIGQPLPGDLGREELVRLQELEENIVINDRQLNSR